MLHHKELCKYLKFVIAYNILENQFSWETFIIFVTSTKSFKTAVLVLKLNQFRNFHAEENITL